MIKRKPEPGKTPMYRQGDVMLLESDLPKDAVKQTVRTKNIPLVFGAVTGHTHAVDKKGVGLYQAGQRRFVVAQEATAIRHEEHGTIDIPIGVWEVINQREYSATEQMSRQVID